jgi:hypothetical protein
VICFPADSPQRNVSVGRNSGGGRASSQPSWAEKENDGNNLQRDAARTLNKLVRSSTGCGGGAKSFMAPTISAASKAVAASASPRKKVLGERNNGPTHPVPSSSSPGDLLAHGKPRGPPPTEEALGAPRRLRLSLDEAPAPPAAAAPPVASHGAHHSLGGEEGVEEVENPVRMVHHHHGEPGDAAAPYDPKTNYLSPRPQFLRYRPNPRVELYHQGGVRRLVDFASSESSEDTDASATTEEEEGLSDEEQESSPPAAVSEAGADTADVLAPKPEPEEPIATSPPVRAPTPDLEPAATPARAPAKKRSSLRFLLVAPFALLLFMVASLVSVPPAPGSPVVLNASLSRASEYFLSSVQELNPVELAAWLKQWSSSSLDFVSSYWDSLASPRKQDFFGPRIAANLSAAVADDADLCLGFYYSAVETRLTPTVQEPISANTMKEEEMEEVASASDALAIEEDMAAFGDATVEDEPIDGEMFQESVSATSSGIEEALYAAMPDEVLGSSGEEMASSNQEMDIPSQSEPEPEHTVGDMDVPSLQQDVQTDESEGDQKEVHVEQDQEAHHGQKLGSDMWSRYMEEFSKPAVAGSVLAILVVSSALAFLYMRQNQSRVSLNPNEQAEDEPTEQVEQVENRPGSGSSEGHAFAQGSHLQNPVVEETERIGGSDASQYSSRLSSGLSKRRKDKAEQSLQNLEPMSRRESTGYSTSSYGSFTTYEKIPAKKVS